MKIDVSVKAVCAALGVAGALLVAKNYNEQAWARHERTWDLLLWLRDTVAAEQNHKPPQPEDPSELLLMAAMARIGTFLQSEGRGAMFSAAYDPDEGKFGLSLTDGDETKRAWKDGGDGPLTHVSARFLDGLISLGQDADL